MSSEIVYYRIDSTDRVWIERKAYRARQRVDEGYVLVREDDPEIARLFTNQELDDFVLAGSLRLERNAFRLETIIARGREQVEFIGDLPERDRKQTGRRHIYAVRCAEKVRDGETTLSDASLKIAIASVYGEIISGEHAAGANLTKDGDPVAPRADQEQLVHTPPSPKTVRTAMKRLEGAGDVATAFRKRWYRCGDRLTQRHPIEVLLILEAIAKEYGSEKRPTVRTLHKKLAAAIKLLNDTRIQAGLEPYRTPSYHRLLQEVKELNNLEVLAGRAGLSAAEADLAAVNLGIQALRPLERVEIDEWRIDLFTVLEFHGLLEDLTPEEIKELKEKRFWLCAVIDAATRIVLGMMIGRKTGVQLALDTVQMAVSPKTPYASIAPSVLKRWVHFGKFEQLAHDQATWYMSPEFRIPLTDLGSEVVAPPAGIARMRPKVERFFGTAKQVLEFFTGRTFENVIVKGDYDPTARASLTVPELCEVLVRWAVDQYHYTEHKGLDKQRPAHVWEKLTKKYGVSPPPPPHDLRAIFGVRVNNCSVSTQGIEYCGLFYNCIELQQFRQKKGNIRRSIKINHRDIGSISVELGDNCWLAVPCLRPGMKNVPLDVWLATRQALRRQYQSEGEISDEIVSDSVQEMVRIANAAEQRTGLISTRPTSKQLTLLNNNINMSFEFLRPDTGPSMLKGNLSVAAILSQKIARTQPNTSGRPSRTLK